MTAGPTAARPRVPAGFGVVLDPSTRRIDGGDTLVGGAPLTVLRLSAGGRAVLDALVAGAPVPAAHGANRLARRLLDLGLAHPRPPSDGTPPPVTVVIPVRDDASGLAITLAGLGPVEQVLVVDDGSGDPAAVRREAAASTQADRTDVVRLDTSRGPGGARQVGWQAATTAVVAFVDAGCQPEADWLGPACAHLADPVVAAVAPRIRAGRRPGTPAWIGAYEALRSPLDLGPAAAPVRPHSRVPYVPTAALVVRRAALEEVGGFDPELRVGEDVDLVWRLVGAGHVVRYEPSVVVVHGVRPTLAALLRQRYDYGRSAALLAERHGAAVAPLAVSPWTAAAWALAAAGHQRLGVAVAGASTVALGPRLGSLGHPWAEALRMAGGAHLRAGRLVGEACRRSWWPLVLLACLTSARARRAALVAAVLPPLVEPRPPPRVLPLPAYVALRLADDLAYGLGVWTGAARSRSADALCPHLTGSRPRTSRWARSPGRASPPVLPPASGHRLPGRAPGSGGPGASLPPKPGISSERPR